LRDQSPRLSKPTGECVASGGTSHRSEVTWACSKRGEV